MSTAGWYPDPDGTPGRYRFWDGRSWSNATTDDPRTAAPGTGARRAAGFAAGGAGQPARAIDPARDQPHGLRRGLIIAGVLLLLIMVAVGGVVVWRNGQDQAGPPAPTGSAWDDSSPTAAPSTPPSPSVSPSPSETAPQLRCPRGNPEQGPGQAADGRVRGGKLSFPAVADYSAPGPRLRLSWFYDTDSQFQVTEPGWQSSFTVGEVQRAGLFAGSHQAADRTLQCMITGDGFEGFAGRKDLRNEAVEIDGRPAWMIMTEVRVDRSDISVEGDRVAVIFVDDGRKDRLSGFVALVPIGDRSRIALLDTVIKGLRVD
ncbi:DUF2510 domain-containing protein [Microlunatus speluncae]|uniref:DUF2510 domain-containing protein n=1 Tax=Microlunatus speluncae TaxID=2594267 RepID=UPI0012661700|nr:DUF2510 domain-containing protein [Microlunatus speluncae]